MISCKEERYPSDEGIMLDTSGHSYIEMEYSKIDISAKKHEFVPYA